MAGFTVGRFRRSEDVKRFLSGVSSVFGRTGAVTAQAGDYTAAQVTNAESTANKGAASGYAGLDGSSKILAANALVSSVFTRTGAVTATSGDYTAAQVTNAADKSSASLQTFTGTVAGPRRFSTIATPTYGTTVTPDASAGQWFTITATNGTAFTIAAPTNPPSSSQTQDLTIEVFNNSGGALGAITWNAVYVFDVTAWANPATGNRRMGRFVWNGSKWVGVSISQADY